MTRWDKAMTARITCSMTMMVIPEAFILLIISTIVSVSVGLRPAIISSKSRSLGWVARDRASSNLFRSGRVRLEAGSFILSVSPTSSRTFLALFRAGPTLLRRFKAPIITLSSTERVRKGLTN